MKKNHSFKLIDGQFSPSDAGKIVFALVSSKINYHSMEKFSNEERFGKDATHSEKRIKALRKVKDSLKKVFDLAEQKGLNVKMNGLIEITIVE
ncbi:hypothetical protein BH10BAC3_BH10BAC3_38170 [soil metagenome]